MGRKAESTKVESRALNAEQRPAIVPSHGKGILRPFVPGQSGNPGGKLLGLSRYILDQTGDLREVMDFHLAVLRGDKDALVERFGLERETVIRLLDKQLAAKELADRAVGKAKEIKEIQPAGEASAAAVHAQYERETPEGKAAIERFVRAQVDGVVDVTPREGK